MRFSGSEDCTISGSTFRDESEEGQASGASLLELEECRRVAVSGCVFTDGVPYGIDALNCSDIQVTGCIVTEGREMPRARGAVRFSGKGQRNGVALNNLPGKIEISPDAGVKLHENID